MDSPSKLPEIAAWARVYRSSTRAPEGVLALVLLTLAIVVGALLQRSLGLGLRLFGVSLFGLCLLGWVTRALWTARVLRTPRRIVEVTLGLVDREQAARVLRAVELVEAAARGVDVGSEELVLAHWTRVAGVIEPSRIRGRLRQRGRRLWLFSVVLSFVIAGVVLARPWAVVEGVVLAVTRGRVAPLMLPYVRASEVRVTFPSYLARSSQPQVLWGDTANVPEGSVVSVRVELRIHGRDLVLTDGEHEVSFEPDGEGIWLAKLAVEEPTAIRIAARFGAGWILDPFEKTIFTEADQAPVVKLASAPRTMNLAEVDRLKLDYVARDDHGLAQIELVVESGRQVVRKELARPARDSRVYQGGYALSADHPLLSRAFLPVRVRIEARDDNTATGPAWGKSEEITLLPEPLGRRLAERYLKLKGFRAQLIDYYAAERSAHFLQGGAREEALLTARELLSKEFARLEQALRSSEEKSEGSLAFLSAQVDALTHSGSSSLTADASILAVDALLAQVATLDARRLAEQVAGAVDEIAVIGRAAQNGELEANREGSLGDVLLLAEVGADQLALLGVLGKDLGSVAKADLARMQASRAERAWDRVERAAVHLAARLRRARPSFGAKGEGGGATGGTPGVESGQGSGPPEPGTGAVSDAPSEFQDLKKETDRLAQDHARELSALERWMEEARRAAAEDAGSEQASDLAERLRESVSNLPEVGALPGTARSEAALGRHQAEAMADALDARDGKLAAERGRAAKSALDRAKRLFEQGGAPLGAEELEVAQKVLDDALRAAQQLTADQTNRRGRALAEEQKARAERERKLAERTEKLMRKGATGSTPLSGKSLDALDRASRLMRRSAEALEQGDVDGARTLAERAQADLERAQPGGAVSPSSSQEGERPDEGEQEGEGEQSESLATDGEVPRAKEGLGQDFRRRVQEGLRQNSGRLGDAVRRYSERLQ